MRIHGLLPAPLLLLPVCILLLSHGLVVLAQHSKPVAHNYNMKEFVENNKFLQREATDDHNPLPHLDEETLANSQCPQNLELRWQAEVGSSIYATPVIDDINGDGKLEIIVPTFVHYVEVLDGSDGENLAGWPVQHQSTVHASALIYDIDKDGNKEIAVATFNGEVLFFRSGGYLLPYKLVVPRRKVKKDWYVGLEPDTVDRSHPDVHDESLITELPKPGMQRNQEVEDISDKGDSDSGKNAVNGTTLGPTNSTEQSAGHEKQESKVEPTIKGEDLAAGGSADFLNAQTQQASVQRRLLQDDGTTGDVQGTTENSVADSGEGVKTNDDTATPTVKAPEDPWEIDAQASFDIFREEDENQEDGLTEEYDYDYDDYVNEAMWGDEDWDEPHHLKEGDLIEVDSHILATPVIADIDNDGVDEMVVAASYFYDRDYYDSAEHAKELGENLDLSKYFAGAIVVFNLETKQVKWDIQLDLSTETTTFTAHIYSSPTVVDLDGDGYLEIIVGTSMGWVYVIEHNGVVKRNFPLLMGDIQGQVVAADINDDGLIEIVTADSRGNVAAWTGEGKEIWEVHLKSLISQGPTVGDVNGDGYTEIVVPTTVGNIYVLRGSDGKTVGPYPFRTHGRVMAPALLVDLSRHGAEKKGLTIVIGSFDGYLYLIDGPTGCADAIDIGETTYSMALADNVDGGEDLDIIVTTMNGNVYCFQTPAPHHPLKAWPMQVQGRNVFASRYQREGIFVVPSSRAFRDEAGDSFQVTFEIVDNYAARSGALGPYQVTMTLLTPGNYRGEKLSRYNYTYEQPGVYTVVLPCLSMRLGASLVVEMLDRNSLYFYDQFALSFHMNYHRLLKWLLALPVIGMSAMFLVFRPQEDAPLPSFSRERHQL